MKTKIKSLTIVNHQGSRTYEVGYKVNNLTIDSIEDHSQEFPDGWNNRYTGYTKDGAPIFQAENVPVDIQFEEVKEG